MCDSRAQTLSGESCANLIKNEIDQIVEHKDIEHYKESDGGEQFKKFLDDLCEFKDTLEHSSADLPPLTVLLTKYHMRLTPIRSWLLRQMAVDVANLKRKEEENSSESEEEEESKEDNDNDEDSGEDEDEDEDLKKENPRIEEDKPGSGPLIKSQNPDDIDLLQIVTIAMNRTAGQCSQR